MEAQLFSDDGFCLRINAAEPLWDVLAESLAYSGVLERPGGLEKDVALGHEQILATRTQVGEVLRRALEQIPRLNVASRYDASVIEVLGRTVPIAVRDPQHYALKRINSLFQCLDKIAKHGGSAEFLLVPDLKTIDHTVLSVLAAAHPDGVSSRELPDLVRDWLAHLSEVTAEKYVAEGLSTASRSVEPQVVLQRVEHLSKWKIISSSGDSVVTLSRKGLVVLY